MRDSNGCSNIRHNFSEWGDTRSQNMFNPPLDTSSRSDISRFLPRGPQSPCADRFSSAFPTRNHRRPICCAYVDTNKRDNLRLASSASLTAACRAIRPVLRRIRARARYRICIITRIHRAAAAAARCNSKDGRCATAFWRQAEFLGEEDH